MELITHTQRDDVLRLPFLLKRKVGQEAGPVRKLFVGTYTLNDMMMESLQVRRRHVGNNRGNVRLCGSTGIVTWRARKF